MNVKKLAVALLAVTLCAVGNSVAEITVSQETRMTDRALHFLNGKFSNRISPHGDCLDVVNDYIFVAWYAGPESDRRVHLSRKKIGETKWVDMTLDKARNTLLKDGRGNSHRTVAIGICPIDGTIHVAYDHHGGALHYMFSEKKAAFVPDSEWKSSLMNPETNRLSNTRIRSTTYPVFKRNEDGDLILYFRQGGSINGEWLLAHYNGRKWSVPKIMVDGRDVPDVEFNAYCEFFSFNDSIYYLATVRSRDDKRRRNRGLFFATVDGDTGTGNFFRTRGGERVKAPIESREEINRLKVAEPETKGHVNARSMVVTPGGVVYISAINEIWMSQARESTFAPKRNVRGQLLSIGNKVVAFEVAGRKSSLREMIHEVESGNDNWKLGYEGEERDLTRNYTVRSYENKIIALIQREGDDSRAIDCIEYEVR